MNGIHDMGGLQDMGRILHEKDEPVFHETWEGRMYGIDRSLRAIGKWNIDAWRHQIDLVPAADYLRMTYYERWLAADEQLLVKHGLVSLSELASGKPDPGIAKGTPVVTAAYAATHLGRDFGSTNDPKFPPRFHVGQQVRARNLNPEGHTQLPRYARGKTGVVRIDHGVYPFPDTNAVFQGENRQHVYAVSFAARELWGEKASPHDTVFVDMWDDYLEQV